MSRAAAERLTNFILGLGVAVAVAVYFARGQFAGVSAAVGVAIAVADWYLLRLIVARVVEGNIKRQAAFAFVLFIKLGALMALVFWLLHRQLVDPMAFTLGMSSLVGGVLIGSFLHILTASAVESEH
jgi:hypothetical protein